MTFDDEFQGRLDQLDNILGPLQDTPAERLDQLRRDYARQQDIDGKPRRTGYALETT